MTDYKKRDAKYEWNISRIWAERGTKLEKGNRISLIHFHSTWERFVSVTIATLTLVFSHKKRSFVDMKRCVNSVNCERGFKNFATLNLVNIQQRKIFHYKNNFISRYLLIVMLILFVYSYKQYFNFVLCSFPGTYLKNESTTVAWGRCVVLREILNAHINVFI